MDFPFIKEALLNLFSKSSCDMYPVKSAPAMPNYRGRIKYDPTKCMGCGMCERVCAGGAISRVIEKTEDIEPVLKKALEISKSKPCMIEVKIDRDINVLPMIPAGKPVVNPITEIDLEA